MDDRHSLHDIRALIEAFEASDWREAHIKTGDVDLFLSKDAGASRPAEAQVQAAGPPAAAASGGPVAAAASTAPTPAPAATGGEAQAGLVEITAPNLGTFYRAPKPGAPPYVEVGQTVEPETEVCLIEVMKLFTAVRAERGGIIREICVSDGDVVEFGQPLFRLEPED